MAKYGEDVYYEQLETPEKFIIYKSPVAKVCFEGKSYQKKNGNRKGKGLNFRDCQRVSADDRFEGKNF